MRLVPLLLISALALPAGAEIIANRFTAGSHQPGAKRRMERRHEAEQERLQQRHARQMDECRASSADCEDLADLHRQEQKKLQKQHQEDHRSFAAARRDLNDNSD